MKIIFSIEAVLLGRALRYFLSLILIMLMNSGSDPQRF